MSRSMAVRLASPPAKLTTSLAPEARWGQADSGSELCPKPHTGAIGCSLAEDPACCRVSGRTSTLLGGALAQQSSLEGWLWPIWANDGPQEQVDLGGTGVGLPFRGEELLLPGLLSLILEGSPGQRWTGEGIAQHCWLCTGAQVCPKVN